MTTRDRERGLAQARPATIPPQQTPGPSTCALEWCERHAQALPAAPRRGGGTTRQRASSTSPRGDRGGYVFPGYHPYVFPGYHPCLMGIGVARARLASTPDKERQPAGPDEEAGLPRRPGCRGGDKWLLSASRGATVTCLGPRYGYSLQCTRSQPQVHTVTASHPPAKALHAQRRASTCNGNVTAM